MGFINKLEFWDFNLFCNRSKTALTANSIDQTSSIMDLKFNHYLELYNTDLKIYSKLAHLKTLMFEFGF